MLRSVLAAATHKYTFASHKLCLLTRKIALACLTYVRNVLIMQNVYSQDKNTKTVSLALSGTLSSLVQSLCACVRVPFPTLVSKQCLQIIIFIVKCFSNVPHAIQFLFSLRSDYPTTYISRFLLLKISWTCISIEIMCSNSQNLLLCAIVHELLRVKKNNLYVDVPDNIHIWKVSLNSTNSWIERYKIVACVQALIHCVVMMNWCCTVMITTRVGYWVQ